MLLQILLRTRLSKPGEPREGPLLERASRMLLQILLRTRPSKPGEPREGPFTGANAAKYWRTPAPPRETLSRGIKPQGLARASPGFLPREASSVSATERTWALRPPQSHGRACAP